MILVPALRAGKPYHSKEMILLRDYATRTSRTREIFSKRCISSTLFNANRSLLWAPGPESGVLSGRKTAKGFIQKPYKHNLGGYTAPRRST